MLVVTHGWTDVPSVSELPPPPIPQGCYVAAQRYGELVFTSGVTPRRNGELVFTGCIGSDLDVEQGRQAAELATAIALSAVADLAGGLRNIKGILHLTVYVRAATEFAGHSGVADGASNCLVQVLGSHCRPARTAVGVCSLPGGSPVEVAMVAVVDGAVDVTTMEGQS